MADFGKEELGGGIGEKSRTPKLSLPPSLSQANSYLAFDAGMKITTFENNSGLRPQ